MPKMRICREIIKKMTAAVFAAAAVGLAGMTSYSAELSLEFVPTASDGDRKYALEYQTAIQDNGSFDPRTMTSDSQVIVEFECSDPGDVCPVELIWQSWGYHSTPVNNWSRVKAAEYGSGYAVFNYADIVSAYGSDDFSEVYTILVRDTGRSVTLKSVRISGLDIPGAETVTSLQTEDENITEEVTEETSPASETSDDISDAEADAKVISEAVTQPVPSDTAAAEAAEETVSDDARREDPPEQRSSGSGVKIAAAVGIIAAAAAVGAVVVIAGRRKKGNRFY